MSLWQAFVDGYRRGFTQGPTVLSIARVALARRERQVEVTFDLLVDNWHGEPVQLDIEVVDTSTQALVARVEHQLEPVSPCWNVTIPRA